MLLTDSVKIMTTFSIASILGDQNAKAKQEVVNDDEEEEEDNQQQILLNNSVQHLYNLFCKNAAVAATRFNEQHQNKTNSLRTFSLGTTPSSSTDYYSLHKLNNPTYQGKDQINISHPLLVEFINCLLIIDRRDFSHIPLFSFADVVVVDQTTERERERGSLYNC